MENTATYSNNSSDRITIESLNEAIALINKNRPIVIKAFIKKDDELDEFK